MKVRSEDLNKEYLLYIENPTEETLSELLKSSTALIRYFAQYFCGTRFDGDIQQAGFEGVLKALKYFNKSYNTSFATYAGHFIIGEIRHYIRKEMRFYKPQVIDGLQKKVQALSQQYYEEKGEMPQKSHIANELNVKEEGINEILHAGLVSFEEIDIDKISSIHYESFKLPVEDQIVLHESIRKLSDIKQSVIYSLFFHNRTQQQTAESLGINQRKVSRLLKSSLTDLKGLINL
jgi:RNA polymerase sigma-B factor